MLDIKDIQLPWFIVFFFFDKKTTSGSRGRSEIMSNRELAEKQHKPTATKSKKQKVQSSFIDNIQSAD